MPEQSTSSAAAVVIASKSQSSGLHSELAESRCLNPSFLLKLPHDTVKMLKDRSKTVPFNLFSSQFLSSENSSLCANDSINVYDTAPSSLETKSTNMLSITTDSPAFKDPPSVQHNASRFTDSVIPGSNSIESRARKSILPLLAPRVSADCPPDNKKPTTFLIIPYSADKTRQNGNCSDINGNKRPISGVRTSQYSATSSCSSGKCQTFPQHSLIDAYKSAFEKIDIEADQNASYVSSESLCSEMKKNRETLKRKLMQRLPAKDLVARGILPGHSTADPFIAEKAHQLKKCKLVDNLKDKLAHRPGPLELVQENILHVNADLERAIKDGRLQFRRTRDGIAKRPGDKVLNVIHGEEDSAALEHSYSIHSSTSVESCCVSSSSHSNPAANHDGSSDMIASKSNVSQPNSDAFANIAIQSSYQPIVFDNFHLPENGLALTNASSFSRGSSNENLVNDIVSGLKLGDDASLVDIEKIAAYKANAPSGTPDKSTSSYVLSGYNNTRNVKLTSAADNEATSNHLSIGRSHFGAYADSASKAESNYELLLQQQTLMLQWEAELKQKYPNATVHFVHAPLVKEACDKLASVDYAVSDFIDIDVLPANDVSGRDSDSPTQMTESRVTAGSNPVEELGSPSKSSLSSSSSSNGRPEKVPKERKMARKLEEMKVQDLKSECRLRNILATGSKSSLIERLKPFEDNVLESERQRRLSAQAAKCSSAISASSETATAAVIAKNSELTTPSKSPTGCSLPPISFLSSCNVGLVLNDDRNAPTPFYAVDDSSPAPSTFGISNQSQATYACLAPPPYSAAGQSSSRNIFEGVLCSASQNDFLTINQADIPDSSPRPFNNSSQSVQPRLPCSMALNCNDSSQQILRTAPSRVILTPPTFSLPPLLLTNGNNPSRTSTNSESTVSMDHSGLTPSSYSSPDLDLSTLNFNASPGSSAAAMGVASTTISEAGSSLIGSFSSGDAQQPNVVLYVQGGGANNVHAVHNNNSSNIETMHSVLASVSNNPVTGSRFHLDNACDANGQPKSRTFSLHEDILENQQNKIEELQRQLQRSQEVLKQQQELILAAKKVQAELLNDNQQQVLHNQQSKQKNGLRLNSASTDNFANKLDTKQMQKIHIQTFLQQKLQQQQLQQLSVQRELVATQQKVEQEMQAHQAVGEVIRLLRQEPRIALLMLSLLKKYHQNQGHNKKSANDNMPPVDFAAENNEKLDQQSEEKSSTGKRQSTDQDQASLSIGQCSAANKKPNIWEGSAKQKDADASSAEKAVNADNAQPSTGKNASGPPKKLRVKKQNCATISNKDAASDSSKPRITKKYSKHKNNAQHLSPKIARKMSVVRVGSSASNNGADASSSSSDANGTVVVNVDMEDIFRSVLHCASKSCGDGDVIVAAERPAVDGATLPSDDISVNLDHNAHYTMEPRGQEIFLYTKNEAFDDLMEVLRDNDGVASSNEASRNSAPIQEDNDQTENGNKRLSKESSSAPNSVGIFPKMSSTVTHAKESGLATSSDATAISNTDQALAGTFLNAFSAQDMADLLSSEWFNVDSVLHNSTAPIHSMENVQSSHDAIATPTTCVPTSVFECSNKSATQHHQMQFSALNNNGSDVTPMECWFDFVLPSSSPRVSSSSPVQNGEFNGIADDKSIPKSVSQNQADSTTTDFVQTPPSVVDEPLSTKAKIFDAQLKSPNNNQSKPRPVLNDQSKTCFSFDDHSKFVLNFGIDQSSSSSGLCRRDPLLIQHPSAMPVYSVTDDGGP